LINIGVPGVNGRMGAAIATQVLKDPALALTVATVRPGNDLVGSKFTASDLIISDTFSNHPVDVVIDFTLPEGVMEHLDYCMQQNIAMVIGATGLNTQQLEFIHKAAQRIPILQGYNMSIGVNKYFKLIAHAAQLFDNNWNLEIHDVHHIHKKDTPSGTAKELCKIIANNSHRSIENIVIHSERRGEAIGTHNVVFSTADESINLIHHAESRDIFAKGAVVAAKWLYGKPAGLYSMQDII
jgi:4-hydroxy-tetrahydrodipicolinate reductase